MRSLSLHLIIYISWAFICKDRIPVNGKCLLSANQYIFVSVFHEALNLFSDHIEEHNWRIKHREEEFKSTIADLREDIETLKNISYHKELQYNDTIDRLNEEIDLIEQIHDELVEAFEAHEIKCNETIADLEEEIMNMTNLIPLAAEALTSGGIANLLQSTQRMYIMVLFMLSIYFSFRLKNFEW